ncbi:MAG TPA: hypothetical protein H9757_02700, partial [Candidatus Mediterraneibacter faecigallinarum]|nr:hypothetical protein [Candidatus Mediterraneibacter faecigallinarum]
TLFSSIINRKCIHSHKVYPLVPLFNFRDCHVNFRMDERRNRQGGIRLSFREEGLGIQATLEKGLENLKAPEDGVNMKSSTV